MTIKMDDLRRIICQGDVKCDVKLFHSKLVEYLKIKGHTLYDRDKSGLTILTWAIYFNNRKIAECLLKCANILSILPKVVNVKNHQGEPLLMSAITRGRIAMIKLLLDNKADINAQDKNGSTALIKAVSHGYKHIVILLLNAGADFYVQTNDGWTALSKAAYGGYTEIVELLVNLGAPLDNTLQCVSSTFVGRPFIYTALKNAGRKIPSLIFTSIDPTIIREIIEHNDILDILKNYAKHSGVALGLCTEFNSKIVNIIKKYLFQDLESQQTLKNEFDRVQALLFTPLPVLSPVFPVTPLSARQLLREPDDENPAEMFKTCSIS